MRLNSDNFPPLISENDKEKQTSIVFFFRVMGIIFLDKYDEKENKEIKIKYKKGDIVKIYQELAAKGEVKIDSKLAAMKEEDIPFLNCHAPLRKVSFYYFCI